MDHSDCGSSYTSKDFKRKTDQNEMILSMNSKGNCYDYAVVKSFFHNLKTEHANFCKCKIKEEAMEYIEVFYNKKRSHSTLEYVPSQEFETRWMNQ